MRYSGAVQRMNPLMTAPRMAQMMPIAPSSNMFGSPFCDVANAPVGVVRAVHLRANCARYTHLRMLRTRGKGKMRMGRRAEVRACACRWA